MDDDGSMTPEKCARAYVELRDHAGALGFATVGEALDHLDRAGDE